MAENDTESDAIISASNTSAINDGLSKEKLIDEMSRRPVMFDKGNARYFDRPYKEEEWRKIAQSIGMTGNLFILFIKLVQKNTLVNYMNRNVTKTSR
jgi:hypothetical protein